MGTNAPFGAYAKLNAAGTAIVLPGGGQVPLDLSSQLKKWRRALANARSGGGHAKLMFLGDSTTAGIGASGATYTANRPLGYPNAVAKRLKATGVNVGVGNMVGVTAANTSNFLAYDTRWTVGAEWTANSLPSLGGGYLVSLNTGASAANFTPLDEDGVALSFDTIDVVYLKNSAYGNFTIAVDGGAAAATSTQAGGGAIDTLTATVSAGTHTVNIAKVGGDAAKHLHIMGINCYTAATKQVHVLSAGRGGGKAADDADASAYYTGRNVLAYYAPDMTIINLTINDILALTSVASYKASLQNIITTAKLSGDVMICIGNPLQSTFSGYVLGNDAPYIAAVRELAASNSIYLLDFTGRFTDWATANAGGFMYDGAHPNRIGYADMAAVIIQALV